MSKLLRARCMEPADKMAMMEAMRAIHAHVRMLQVKAAFRFGRMAALAR